MNTAPIQQEIRKADTSGRIMLLLSLWITLLVVAVMNGYVREVYVVPSFGRVAAQVYGVVVLSAVVWLAGAYFARGTRGDGWRAWAGVAAVVWVAMTVGFEFAFGLYVAGKPLQELMHAYYIWEGELWPLVLLSEAVAPWIMGLRENRAATL
ncbi:MAG: hypothetical protein AB7V46_20225 [Thermomicrobiales bacterium]